MKKLVALLMSLCMLLGAAAAFAETDPLVEAFDSNVKEHFRSLDLSKQALAFTVQNPAQNTAVTLATLQQADGVYELLFTPDERTAITVQSDGNDFWFSDGGEVYGLPGSVIEELVADWVAGVNPLVNLTEEDKQVLSEIAGVFVEKSLMPYMSYSFGGNGAVKVTLAMDGTQLTAAAADFLETVAAEPRYTGVLAKLYNNRMKLTRMTYDAVMQKTGSNAGTDATLQALMQEQTADTVAELLRKAVEEVKKNTPDVVINGTVEITADGITGHASVTANGKTVYVDGNVTADTLTARIYDAKSTYADLTLNWGERLGERFVTGRLELPAAKAVISLDGTLGSNSLRGTLQVDANGQTTSVLVSAMWMNGTLDANLSVNSAGKNVLTANLHKANGQVSLTAGGENFSLTANAAKDGKGEITGRAALTIRSYGSAQTLEVSWDGTTLMLKAPGTEIKAALRGISDTQMAVDVSQTYESYYSGTQTQNATVTLTLTDTADGWTLTAENSQEGTTVPTLGTAPLHEQTMLRDKVTKTLTEKDIINMYVDLLIPSRPSYNYYY